MKKHGAILVVDDHRGVLSAVSLLLRPYFGQVITLPSPVRIDETLRSVRPDCVLLDMNFSAGINNGNEGLYWLAHIKRINPDMPVVLFTAYADIDLAVKGIQQGASDFIVKPWENARLVETVLKASSRTKKNTSSADNGMFWGESDAMKRLRDMVERVAPTDANVLITGENGTGKEVLARELHRLSGRRDKPMSTVDMGSVTESLFESELFGHVKGAFTHAVADRQGKFEAADGSTLFMDEIGNMPPHLQSKLLVALQNREVVRVGSNKPVKIDIRLICATNRNLEDMVRDGRFREDLLYRINTIQLQLPPLRERKEDIVPLARIFMERFARQYDRRVAEPGGEVERLLLSHSWPGNIRELQHAVEKAVILSDGERLDPRHFTLAKPRVDSMDGGRMETLEDMERHMIAKAVGDCGGNLSAVASKLGITRQTLYNKMKKYGL